jgi:hypothetical protein
VYLFAIVDMDNLESYHVCAAELECNVVQQVRSVLFINISANEGLGPACYTPGARRPRGAAAYLPCESRESPGRAAPVRFIHLPAFSNPPPSPFRFRRRCRCSPKQRCATTCFTSRDSSRGKRTLCRG